MPAVEGAFNRPVWRQQIMATAILVSVFWDQWPSVSTISFLLSGLDGAQCYAPRAVAPPPRLIVLHLRSFLRLQCNPPLNLIAAEKR